MVEYCTVTRVRKNTGGSDVGTQRRFNFIEGTNITLTIAEDETDGEIDVQIAASGAAAGDMTKVVYDPDTIEADAFDADNHKDGTTNKVYTATEKTKLGTIAENADVTGDNAPQAHKTSHQNGGGDEISVAGLSGLLADDQHVLDAEAISAVEAAGLVLADTKAIEYTTPSGDHTASGIIKTKTAGAALVFGNACYTGTDGKMEKALADDAAITIPATHLCIATIAENAEGLFLEQGEAMDESWSFDIGKSVYLSKDTAGLITKTMPTKVTGNQVQVLGTCVETTAKIFWNPSPIVVEYA